MKIGNKVILNKEKAISYLTELNEIKESLPEGTNNKELINEMKTMLRLIRYSDSEYEVMKIIGNKISFTLSNSRFFPSELFFVFEEDKDEEEELDYEL